MEILFKEIGLKKVKHYKSLNYIKGFFLYNINAGSVLGYRHYKFSILFNGG